MFTINKPSIIDDYALEVVTKNYGVYREVRQQLTDLQAWVRRGIEE